MKKKRINEGLVDKLITKFFDSLRAGQERAYMEKLKNAKVNPEILAHMEKMENHYKDLKKLTR